MHGGIEVFIIGAGFSGMYMLHSLRDEFDLNVTVFEPGDGGGRHLVLESLSRRALRFRQLRLPLHLRQEPVTGMELVRALPRAGRGRTLSEHCAERGRRRRSRSLPFRVRSPAATVR
ncbi:MAG: NAD(P)-binding protein [Bradyrhizobium sp.]|jgi:cation diffusion facilitator CzcD-associated flavoprotein CzcO